MLIITGALVFHPSLVCVAGDEDCLLGPLLQQPGLVSSLLEAVLRILAHPQQQQQQVAARPTHWPAAAAAFDPDPMNWRFNEQLLGLLEDLTRADQQQQLAAAFSRLGAAQDAAALQQLQSLALAMMKVLASSSRLRAPDDCALRSGYVLSACLTLPAKVAQATSSSSSSQAAGKPHEVDDDSWEGWEHGSDFAAVAVARCLVLASRLLRLSLGDDSTVLGSISMESAPSLLVAAGGLASLLWLCQLLGQVNHGLLALAKSQLLAAADGGAAVAQQCGQLAEAAMQLLAPLSDVLDAHIKRGSEDDGAGAASTWAS
jgi:hypothetical protein